MDGQPIYLNDSRGHISDLVEPIDPGTYMSLIKRAVEYLGGCPVGHDKL